MLPLILHSRRHKMQFSFPSDHVAEFCLPACRGRFPLRDCDGKFAVVKKKHIDFSASEVVVSSV